MASAPAVLARWDALMRSVEVPFAAAIVAEKDRYIEEAAADFAASGRLQDRHYDVHAALMMGIAERYDGIAIRIALTESLKGIKQLRHAVERKEGWDALWLFLVRSWVTEHGAQRARETAETTRGDLQRIIEKALAHDVEFNPVAVAVDLLQVRDLSPWRASTIARTEVHGAMMYASEEGASKLSRDNDVAMKKKWLPVHDERTRINHAAMSSVSAIPLDADFTVGGFPMKRPGDPRGGAANCINCRCVLGYEVVE